MKFMLSESYYKLKKAPALHSFRSLEEINDPSETKLPIVKIMLGCEFGESPKFEIVNKISD